MSYITTVTGKHFYPLDPRQSVCCLPERTPGGYDR